MTDRLYFYAKEHPCVEMAFRYIGNDHRECVVMLDGRVFSMSGNEFKQIRQRGYQVSVCATIDMAGESHVVDKMINSTGMKPVVFDTGENEYYVDKDMLHNIYSTQQFGLKPVFMWEERQLYCGGLFLARLNPVPVTGKQPPRYMVKAPILRETLIECGLKRGLTEWRTEPLVLFDFKLSCKILQSLYSTIFNDMTFALRENRNFIA